MTAHSRLHGYTSGGKSMTGVGHGKSIVCGEHFVLDGAAALAVALPELQTTVTLTLKQQPPTQLETDTLLDSEQVAIAEAMVRAAAHQIGISSSLHAKVESNLPVGRGLGSSAAFSVALCKAATGWLDTALTPVQLLVHCQAVENVVHGHSSGLDPATAMAGGGVLFKQGAVIDHVAVAQGGALSQARWVLADIGPAPSTKTAISVANRARERLGQAALDALVAQVDDASRQAAKALRDDNLGALAESMQRCGVALQALDVVDRQMQQVRKVSLASGALAIKQTGSGLGGNMLALAPNAQIAETVAAQLTSHVSSVRVMAIAL